MTLHYRKLLVASLAFPFLVLGCLTLTLPSLMQTRSSAVFAQMRANARTMEQLVEIAAATNADQALEAPLNELREVVQRHQDGLLDLRDVMLSESQRGGGQGWLAVFTGGVAVIGTLSSIVLSWRADMRQSRAELARLQAEPNRGDRLKSAA